MVGTARRDRSPLSLVVKLLCLLTLLMVGREVIAQCTSYAEGGWAIGSICRAQEPPDNGAECVDDQYYDPCESMSSMCFQTWDQQTGTSLCYGSNCSNEPCEGGGGGGGGGGCTETGKCDTSLDCCGAGECWFGWCYQD